MLQMKKQDKTPQEQLNEEEIGNLFEKQFRVIIVKMILKILEIEWRNRSRRYKNLTRS